MKVEGKAVIIKDVEEIFTDIDVNEEFISIIGEDFYKKLINYASAGLLFQKFDSKHIKRYTFYQWVENDIDMNISEEHNLYRLLLKQVWSFNFLDIPETISKIKAS